MSMFGTGGLAQAWSPWQPHDVRPLVALPAGGDQGGSPLPSPPAAPLCMECRVVEATTCARGLCQGCNRRLVVAIARMVRDWTGPGRTAARVPGVRRRGHGEGTPPPAPVQLSLVEEATS